jgi:hypothetical protein
MLWFSSEKNKANILVACSGSETNPALSIVKHTHGKDFSVVARSA